MKAFIRKHWLGSLIFGSLLCCIVDGFFIEPHWVKITRLSVGDHPSLRIVHLSDLHYKGDRSYLMRVVGMINQLEPDAVCFTGDIIEDARWLDEALDVIGRIRSPVYGVPGNHEYWSRASFDRIGEGFRKTGGAWLMDRSVLAAQGRLLIGGRSGVEINTRRDASGFAMPGRKMEWTPLLPAPPSVETAPDSSSVSLSGDGSAEVATPSGARRILLTHYPRDVENVKGGGYDVILAGHAHGGQVRLPFLGALIVPFGVNGYQKGTYATPAGLLHVSAGIGTLLLPVRFFCRPEITLIEI